jgi:RNase P protein component
MNSRADWMEAYSEKRDRRAEFFTTLVRLGYTHEQVGTRFGISASRVNQIVRRERYRRAREFKQAEFNLTAVERILTGKEARPKVISKVHGPLIDTGLDPTIASGGST